MSDPITSLGDVSPEFMLRPSLSGCRQPSPTRLRPDGVSPEFMLRPSLSGRGAHELQSADRDVSPEFMLRPSLSGLRVGIASVSAMEVCVAGVYAPAFVERA